MLEQFIPAICSLLTQNIITLFVCSFFLMSKLNLPTEAHYKCGLFLCWGQKIFSFSHIHKKHYTEMFIHELGG